MIFYCPDRSMTASPFHQGGTPETLWDKAITYNGFGMHARNIRDGKTTITSMKDYKVWV